MTKYFNNTNMMIHNISKSFFCQDIAFTIINTLMTRILKSLTQLNLKFTFYLYKHEIISSNLFLIITMT
jgi:hypothetical protein